MLVYPLDEIARSRIRVGRSLTAEGRANPRGGRHFFRIFPAPVISGLGKATREITHAPAVHARSVGLNSLRPDEVEAFRGTGY